MRKNKFYRNSYDECMHYIKENNCNEFEFNITNVIVSRNAEVWQVWGHHSQKGFARIVGEFTSLVAAVNSIPFDELEFPYTITSVPWDYNEAVFFEKNATVEFKNKYPRYVSVNK